MCPSGNVCDSKNDLTWLWTVLGLLRHQLEVKTLANFPNSSFPSSDGERESANMVMIPVSIDLETTKSAFEDCPTGSV